MGNTTSRKNALIAKVATAEKTGLLNLSDQVRLSRQNFHLKCYEPLLYYFHVEFKANIFDLGAVIRSGEVSEAPKSGYIK